VTLPENHAQRRELNDEVHARPMEALRAPARLSYLVMYSDWANREREWQAVHDLATRLGATPPAPGATHYSAPVGALHLKWERHTEFARYTLIASGRAGDDPFAAPPIALVPSDWIASLPGQTLVASDVAVIRADPEELDPEALAERLFQSNVLVGGAIADGAGAAYTDFRIRADGFGRLLVNDVRMTPRQSGRMVQRLLEIDTYRIMALLALPTARGLAPALTRSERDLAAITEVLAAARAQDEASLLERLTRLSAEIESREAQHHYRFSAAEAYYDLVQRRIVELRETRLYGLQTFNEFTERRLAPAMNTCKAVAARQSSLSERVARATQLLSTRVDLTRERQNQAVLESMNRRGQMQLRLQQTVEGLSIAAVTYYVSGLVGYLAKGLKSTGVAVNPDVAIALSIPIVAIVAYLGVRKIRRMVEATPA
jgi:uncharacterized membrane-anchored protein